VETEQDLLARAREQVEVWEEAAAEAVWAETVRDQALLEIVFARIAARNCRISGECLVIQ